MEKAIDPVLPLRGGFMIRESIAMWLIDASFRLQFAIVADALVIAPPGAMTAEDVAFVRQHRDTLTRAVQYCARIAASPPTDL